ncbi:MAG: hypothetical protein WCE38_19475 [Burkholderiales bacterium]
MKRGYARRWLIACALAAAFVGPAPAGEPRIIEGRVVGVADGDTVRVLDVSKTQHKIRLSGIDAPGTKQPFGHSSMQDLEFHAAKAKGA